MRGRTEEEPAQHEEGRQCVEPVVGGRRRARAVGQRRGRARQFVVLAYDLIPAQEKKIFQMQNCRSYLLPFPSQIFFI